MLVLGLYLPPVLKKFAVPAEVVETPPHTTISVPVQTAVNWARADGALLALTGVQVLVLGLYLPPVFRWLPLFPPQTIISLPVQTAE